MARPHMQLATGQWYLWRLGDDEFVSLGHHALPLVQNYQLLLRLSQRTLPSGATLSLGHTLAVLERRFGPSSPLFDNYRGSFSFPLLLTFEREQRKSMLVRCHDHRGMLHFPQYLIIPSDPSVEERSHCHAPETQELSQVELDEVITSLHGYLIEQAALLETELVAPFYRAVQSDLLVYGYDSGAFFERSYPCWADYEQARQELEVRLGPRRARSSSDRVERMIDRVTQR
jgi:hypothetical protein